MNWFLLALLAPLLWSIANYLDKYILSRSEGGEGGSGGLLILSAIVSAIFAFFVALSVGIPALSIGSQPAGALILSGMIEALYILFYFLALESESTTTVIALFQFAPVFGLLFGYLMLAEIPTLAQIAAVALILLGTLSIVFKKGEKFAIKGSVLLLMIISTVFVGFYNTIFKAAGMGQNFWTAIFWQYVGIVMIGFVLFVSFPDYRKQLWQMVSRRGGGTLAITGLAEVMNIGALLATNAAVLLAPVALVLSISSVQPIFVLIEGLLLGSLFPKLFDPSEKPELKVQYVLGILLVCIGGFLIY